MLLLLLAAACDEGGSVRTRPHDPDARDTGGLTDPDTSADADGDGVRAPDDCDDADPGVHPGAAEVCDGADQDCDGAADDGIPSDGAGCADPGPPAFPDTVDTLHLTLRTGDGTYDGTDDGDVTVCVSADLCFSPYNPEWNDLEAGQLDVTAYEGLDVPRASLDRLTVSTTDGSDLWRPVGIVVTLDGELAYCRDLDVDLGDASDETLSWTDPDGFGVGCVTVFDAPLTHGPIVGAVGPDRARLWYRTDATRHVELRVAESETALADATPIHHGYPRAEDDFAESVDVVGLSPSTRYSYSIEVEGEIYGPWSFTTAPADGTPGQLRLAFGSCSKEDEQPVFGAVLAYAPDLFLFLGDNHYGNTADLSDLRQYYRWAHERPLRSALLSGTSTLAVWDDHDYVGNNTDGSDPGRDTSLRVFREYIPNATYGTDDTPGVFTRASWGDVDLFLLDDRYYRGLDGTLLGAAQTAWLVDGLAASTATFKVVASGSQFTPYGSDDSWAAYPDDLEALEQAIVADRIDGVVLLSGDIHRFELRALTPADGGYVLPEITSSPLAYPTPSTCGSDATEPDRVYCDDGRDGFVGLDFDTTVADPTLSVTFFDTAGGERSTWSTTLSALSLP